MEKKYTQQYNRSKLVNDLNNYRSTYKNLLNKEKALYKNHYEKNQKIKQEPKIYESKMPKSKDMNRLQQQNQKKYSHKYSQYAHFPSSQLNSPKNSYQANQMHKLQKSNYSKQHLTNFGSKIRHFNYNSCEKLKGLQMTDRQQYKFRQDQKKQGNHQNKGSQTKKQKSINYFGVQKTPQLQNNYSQSAQNFVSNFKFEVSKQNTPSKLSKMNKMQYCPISSVIGSRKSSLSFLQSINSTMNFTIQNQNNQKNKKIGQNLKKQTSGLIKEYSINKKIAKGEIHKSNKQLHLNSKKDYKKTQERTEGEITKKSIDCQKNNKQRELSSIQYQYQTNKTKSMMIKSEMIKSQNVSRKNSQNCKHKIKNDSYYENTKSKQNGQTNKLTLQNQEEHRNFPKTSLQQNSHFSNSGLSGLRNIQTKYEIKPQAYLKKSGSKKDKTFQYSGANQSQTSQFLVFDQIQLKEYMKTKNNKNERCITHQNSKQIPYINLSMNRYQTDRQHKKTSTSNTATKTIQTSQKTSHKFQGNININQNLNLNQIYQRMKTALESYQKKQIDWLSQKQIYIFTIKQLQQKLIKLANSSHNSTTNPSESSKNKSKNIAHINMPISNQQQIHSIGYNNNGNSSKQKQKSKNTKKQVNTRHKYSCQY